MPLNQLQMMKLLVNQSLYAQGLHTTQILGTVFDGIARHTPEGYAFQGLAAAQRFQGRGPRTRRASSETSAARRSRADVLDHATTAGTRERLLTRCAGS